MRRKKINFKGICIATFVVALVCTILANIMIPKNDIASSFKLPLLIVSVVLLVILLVLSIKKAGATTAFINALLSVVMIFGCIAVPKLEEKDKNYSSLALGGLTQGVTVEEMAGAYCTFVNSGKYIKPYTYTRVLDSTGQVILENTSSTSQALSLIHISEPTRH